MAKNNCAICGAEVGLISGQKLADGNYICRKVCSAKTLKEFNKVEAYLGDVTAHIEQVEMGTRIWNELLLPLKKSKNKEEKLKMMGIGGPLLYASASTGLVALVETRYKFLVFGKSEHVCVYRIADLIQYDYEVETKTNSEGKQEQTHFCVMAFKETAGLYTFRLKVSGKKEYESIAKYFDTLFGIQKTLGNAVNNAKRQLDAFKTAFNTVKAAADGTLDETQAAAAVETLDASVYGDRTQWIAKADAALAPYKQ